jgi:phage gpG-like protein
MAIERALALVGQMMESDMRSAIAAGIPPPNAARTIAAKGSSKPLVDSGQLRASISSAVVLHGDDGGVVNTAEAPKVA